MSSIRPVNQVDHTASDVLAVDSWTGRAGGLDVACTKAAVDLQNLTPKSRVACIEASLATLREVAGADVAFLAMLDALGATFDAVTVAQVPGVVCNPDALSGVALADLPFLASRFEHLRLTEYRDTALPRRELPAEAQRLAQLGIASALILAFHIENRPAGVVVIARSVVRGPWDVNLQLLL
jgi:hypothetical protein